MIKSIFKQLWNCKQNNVWVTVELALVFCLVWFIADYFFVLGCNYNIPNHRDTAHTWHIEVAEYPPDYAAYNAEANLPETLEANFNRILRTIRNDPDVVALGISFFGSIPGGNMMNGQAFRSMDDTSRIVGGLAVYLDPREDFFGVFGYTAGEEHAPVSTHDFDWSDPRGIVVGRMMAQMLFADGRAVGKEVASPNNMERRNDIIGVVDDIKRFNHLRPLNASCVQMRLDSTNLRFAEVTIRSRAAIPDDVFRERFVKEMENALQIGNFYLKDMTSTEQIGIETDVRTGQTNNVRTRLWLMLFFLLNILLCVLGTFRYRIHTRRHEIGLRKAMGASRADINRQFLAEGLCLLAVAAMAAIVINANIVYAGLIETPGADATLPVAYLPDNTGLRFLITNALTTLTLASVIISAIWLPARRAAALPAAEALRIEN